MIGDGSPGGLRGMDYLKGPFAPQQIPIPPPAATSPLRRFPLSPIHIPSLAGRLGDEQTAGPGLGLLQTPPGDCRHVLLPKRSETNYNGGHAAVEQTAPRRIRLRQGS